MNTCIEGGSAPRSPGTSAKTGRRISRPRTAVFSAYSSFIGMARWLIHAVVL
ncbi:MAG: hypothetical protein ACLVC5_09555 [Clostridia bacterium]